jgi:PKHD-type hydroxylase
MNRVFDNLTLLSGNSASTGMHLDWLRCATCISSPDCDELVLACSQFPLSPPTTVGEDRYPDRRQSDTRKVGLNGKTQWLFDFLATIAHEATQNVFGLDLAAINRAPQYVEYRPGWGHFDWHNDYSHGVMNAPRKLTIIVQLSDESEYEGGKLQIFGPEIEELPTARGTVLLFPSILYHRVTPVTKGVRRALVAWIAGPRMR